MLKRFEVGSVVGIPISLDVTILVVIPLIAWAIATDVTAIVDLIAKTVGVGINSNVLTTSPWPIVLGVLAAVGLFFSVVLHELGHSVAASRRGYGIERIDLWLLGGVAQFADDPKDWADEFQIAVAGPVVSVCLGIAGIGLLFGLPGSLPRVQFLVGYLGFVNLLLAGFNLLPGFPMDGGRVLRAILSRNRTRPEATNTAAKVGQGVAVLMGLVGLLSPNVFLLAIAVFVFFSAAAEATQTRLQQVFEETTVSELMTPAKAVETVPPRTSVATLLDRMFSERHIGYPVTNSGDVVGIVTLEDLDEVAEDELSAVSVRAVMSEDPVTVSADAPVTDAIEQLDRHDVGRLVITDDAGSMVGLLSRSDVLRAFAVAQNQPQSGRSEGAITRRPSTD